MFDILLLILWLYCCSLLFMIIYTVNTTLLLQYHSTVSCSCQHVADIKRTQRPLTGTKPGNLYHQHHPAKVGGAELTISHMGNKESGMRRVLQERAQPTY